MTTNSFLSKMTLLVGALLLALLSPLAVWAHTCGSGKLNVKKGDTVEIAIPGSHLSDYKVINKGNPLVARIEPPSITYNKTGVFNITGVGNGTTKFAITWTGGTRDGVCHFKVTVEE